MPENIEVTRATPAINTPVILRGPWLFSGLRRLGLGVVDIRHLCRVCFARHGSCLEKDISDNAMGRWRGSSYAAYTRIVLAARYTHYSGLPADLAVFIFKRRSRDPMGCSRPRFC